MSLHTALLDLPGLLDNAGFNVEVADDWELGQCNSGSHYMWTDPDTHARSHDQPPSGYMVHHTATTATTPPPAGVSKANAWIGLKAGTRLYQATPVGAATIYFASAGPCRVSSGYGYRPAAWDYTFQDRRAPATAAGSDTDTALNRYVFNVEVVHPGNGTALDRDVWDHTVALGQTLHDMFGWTERTLGHKSWSKRKIDPYWTVGLPNDGTDCVVDIQDAIAGMPVEGDTMRKGDTGPNVLKLQNYLNRWLTTAGAGYPPTDPIAEDGIYGSGTEARVLLFQQWASLAETGFMSAFDMATLTMVIRPDRGDQ